jgi:hypothetical protein
MVTVIATSTITGQQYEVTVRDSETVEQAKTRGLAEIRTLETAGLQTTTQYMVKRTGTIGAPPIKKTLLPRVVGSKEVIAKETPVFKEKGGFGDFVRGFVSTEASGTMRVETPLMETRSLMNIHGTTTSITTRPDKPDVKIITTVKPRIVSEETGRTVREPSVTRVTEYPSKEFYYGEQFGKGTVYAPEFQQAIVKRFTTSEQLTKEEKLMLLGGIAYTPVILIAGLKTGSVVTRGDLPLDLKGKAVTVKTGKREGVSAGIVDTGKKEPLKFITKYVTGDKIKSLTPTIIKTVTKDVKIAGEVSLNFIKDLTPDFQISAGVVDDAIIAGGAVKTSFKTTIGKLDVEKYVSAGVRGLTNVKLDVFSLKPVKSLDNFVSRGISSGTPLFYETKTVAETLSKQIGGLVSKQTSTELTGGMGLSTIGALLAGKTVPASHKLVYDLPISTMSTLTKPRTEIFTTPISTKITAPFVTGLTGLKPVITSKNKVFESIALKTIISPQTIITPRTTITPKTSSIITPKTIQIPKTKSLSITKPTSIGFSFPSININIGTPITSSITPFKIPDYTFKPSKKKKKEELFPAGFAPSLTAKIFNIKTSKKPKTKKIWTGLELRKIQK